MSEENANETHIQIHRDRMNETVTIPNAERSINTMVPIENEDNREETNERVSASSVRNMEVQRRRELIIIDGPYSSCARYIFDCRHVILVGGGIGVAPYASILSSLMFQFLQSCVICRHCHGVNYMNYNLENNNNLKRVDFIWVTSESKNFEWFLHLLCELEKNQEDYMALSRDEYSFLNIQLYFTRIKNTRSVDQVFLNQVINIWAQEFGSDIFTGLKSRTRFDRPEWNRLFQDLTANDDTATKRDIDVFFCGPKTMGMQIQQNCVNYGIRYYEERF